MGKNGRGKWRKPAEIQLYPQAHSQRIQYRMPDGRCHIARGHQITWAIITEWRFA